MPMAISLKNQKKLKKVNSTHKNQPSVLTKNPSHHIISNKQCKTRVQFPKLMVKSMQRRNHRCNDQKNANCKKRSEGPKKLHILPKTIETIINVACGISRRKEQETYVYVTDEDGEHEHASNGSDSSEETQDADSTNGGNGNKNSDKQALTVPLSFARIFSKSKGFHLRNWKSFYVRFNGKEVSGLNKPSAFGRVPSTKVMPKMDVKQKKILKEAVGDVEVGEDSNGGLELCKKRILMGGKCRPLNQSGMLHYDQDGVLMPEDVLSSEES